MSSKPLALEAPQLVLNACSVDEHCEALVKAGTLPYWWYQGTSSIFGNFSTPFRDNSDNWWYQVRPGFAWPVETYKLFDPTQVKLPISKTFVGYQCLTTEEASGNRVVINTNLDLKNYGPDVLKKDRRKGVRKGLARCSLTMLGSLNDEILDGCVRAWNDLCARTGWKRPVAKDFFERSWNLILSTPGYSIILARDRSSGQIAGFFITKIIGDTICGDTIAVRDDMLQTRANDALRYAFIINAAKIPGVTKACCSVKSNDVGLEDFKASLGYEPISFPAFTKLRLGFRQLIKHLFADHYNRLMGKY
jgi:hypothetical protein